QALRRRRSAHTVLCPARLPATDRGGLRRRGPLWLRPELAGRTSVAVTGQQLSRPAAARRRGIGPGAGLGLEPAELGAHPAWSVRPLLTFPPPWLSAGLSPGT